MPLAQSPIQSVIGEGSRCKTTGEYCLSYLSIRCEGGVSGFEACELVDAHLRPLMFHPADAAMLSILQGHVRGYNSATHARCTLKC